MTEEEVFEHFKIFGRNLSGDDNCIRDLAKKITLWHLKELKKAELKARIYFLNSFLEKLITLKSYPSITSKSENATTKSDKIEDFITELQSELRKMEEDNE